MSMHGDQVKVAKEKNQTFYFFLKLAKVSLLKTRFKRLYNFWTDNFYLSLIHFNSTKATCVKTLNSPNSDKFAA